MTWFQVTASGTDTARVLIRGDIGGKGVTADAFDRALTALGPKPTTEVVIHSRGGDPWEAFNAYNHLRTRARAGSKIVTRVENLALSAASIIAMAGDEIVAPRNAWLMLHNSRIQSKGETLEASGLRQRADLLDTIDGEMLEAYARHAKLERHELAARMAAETYLTAEQAKEIGLVHVVEDPVAVAARLDLSLYAAAPPSLIAAYHSETEMPLDPKPTTPAPTASGDETKHTAQPAAEPPAAPPTPEVTASGGAQQVGFTLDQVNAIVTQAVATANASLITRIDEMQAHIDAGARTSMEADVRSHVHQLVAQGRVRPHEEELEVTTLLALPDDDRIKRIQALGGRQPIADVITAEWTEGDGDQAKTVTASVDADEFLVPDGAPDGLHVNTKALHAIAKAEADHPDDWQAQRRALFASAGETP